MTKQRIIQLEAPAGSGIRFVGDRVDALVLAEGKREVVVNIIRTGEFTDPRYGKFEVTRELLESFIRNFNARTFGQDIAVDRAHSPEDGAAGYIKELFLDGNKLRGRVELTEYGLDLIKNKGYRYMSADYVEDYVDNETGQKYGPLLRGAGLVVRPAIKRLDPIQLSESDDESPRLFDKRVLNYFHEEGTKIMKEFIEKLKKALEAKKLHADVQKQLLASFEAAGKLLGDDKEVLGKLLEQFEATAKTLAESVGPEPVKLEIKIPEAQPGGGKTLSEEDVLKLMEKQSATAAEAAKELQENKDANVKLFTEAIDAAKDLPEDLGKTLKEAGDLITAEMTEDQVKSLAENQIKLGNQMIAQSKLSMMGYAAPGGSPRIEHGADESSKQLQEAVHTALKGTSRYASGALKLPEKVSPFVEVVLAEFDRMPEHAERLHNEAKLLAGENTQISDTDLPVGFKREVIREALSDLNILDLVQGLTDPLATATTQIPYEVRDDSGVLNDGIVYEGQGIHGASVSQAMDLAYIAPMKLAMKLTNEVIHFSRASGINWDAFGRNVATNARIMRELMQKRLANDMQRSSDAYLATSVANEDFGAQLDGATVSTIKTVNFPIVRQFQAKDLAGTNIGSAENPITVQINSVAIVEYDGSNTQSAGTYYRITNYNLGYVQFVSELGVPVFPAATAGDEFIDYDYATNIVKFDLDIQGSETLEVRLNGLLQAVGARKAVLSGDRFVMPNYILMSPALNDTATNAETFAASMKRDGADTNSMGDLERIKGINAWGTNAPGIDLGDERILMGQRGTMTYTIAKPFVTGQPFEAVDTNGKPTGQKVAYGEEYSAIKVPTPIRNRMTSVIAYSVAGRAAV